MPSPVFPCGLSPGEAAWQLAGLEGMAWLDEAGPAGRWGGALLAARPQKVVHGNLLRERPGRAPGGAIWLGWIDYDGEYVFGLYPDWLRYDARTGGWTGSGEFTAGKVLGHGPPPPVRVSMRACEGQAAYEARVRAAQEYIRAGDIYQVNLARDHVFALDDPRALRACYERLRRLSPSPHGAYLELGGRVVLSASPETFLDLRDGTVLTRPIKGTRPRGRTPREDARLAAELEASPKERAELVMITDLERNDLGRVARTGSVAVPRLCRLESFAQVHHLVSDVTAQVREACDVWAVLAACFPGGSVTGAPKKRAMEIIRELEPFERGLFTGAIGWTDGSGRGVFSIAIRTAWWEAGQGRFLAGAGIVADSDPAAEYRETCHKARGMVEGMGG